MLVYHFSLPSTAPSSSGRKGENKPHETIFQFSSGSPSSQTQSMSNSLFVSECISESVCMLENYIMGISVAELTIRL